MSIFEATIEEFEQGAWVADLVSVDDAITFPFGLPDGSTWQGTVVPGSGRQEPGRFYTRVIGGANGLSKTLPDKFYDGSVSLAVAVGDVCREAGETVGSVTPGLFLNTYERIKGTAAQALDSLSAVFGLIWWIGRDGTVNMAAARPTGADADGTRVTSDVDGSIVLVEPSVLTLGVGYATADPTISMALVRHIRWKWTAERFQAQLYPVPFLFRSPVQTAYSCLYNAGVDTDHGDGTIDVIVAGRFGVTRVPLFSGIPGSKIQVRGGEQVTLGFFGGDPQKPFAVAMAQDTTATKQVARNTDPVKVTLTAGPTGTMYALAGLIAPLLICASPASPPTVGLPALSLTPLDVDGTIQSGTSRISVGD